MWKALDLDWRKCLAARAMKQRATFFRPCLSQQLGVCGLYFVHRWFAHEPPRDVAGAGVVAPRNISKNAAAIAARRIVDGHLSRVGARARAAREHGGGAGTSTPGRSPAEEGRRAVRLRL